MITLTRQFSPMQINLNTTEDVSLFKDICHHYVNKKHYMGLLQKSFDRQEQIVLDLVRTLD